MHFFSTAIDNSEKMNASFHSQSLVVSRKCIDEQMNLSIENLLKDHIESCLLQIKSSKKLLLLSILHGLYALTLGKYFDKPRHELAWRTLHLLERISKK